MWNVLYRNPIAINMANCLFQQEKSDQCFIRHKSQSCKSPFDQTALLITEKRKVSFDHLSNWKQRIGNACNLQRFEILQQKN